MMRKVLFILLAMMLAAGCTAAPPAETKPQTGDASYPSMDRAGNTISKPKKLDAIASLAPSVTQTLIHLGLADKIVAIDTNSAALEGVPQGLPQVDLLNPNGEILVDISPDLAIASAMTEHEGSNPLQIMKDNGAVVAVIPSSNSIADIKLDVRFVADLVNEHAKGEEITAAFQTEIDAIAAKTANAEKRSVYFEIASAPYAYSFGKNTFLNEMIELAGGANIFADTDSWLSVNEEQVVERNPDVIFTNVTYIEDPIGEIMARESLQGTNAVVNGDVFFIENNSSSLSNEYIVTALRQMAEALHPDLWKS